ncbi:hypothetical protein GCM10010160_59110 [Acrocarpospora corrugata]
MSTRRQQYEEWLAEQEREETAKRARWEAAMGQARSRAVDDYRNMTFANALDAWGAASEIREFCAALDQAAAGCQEPVEAERLRPWIEWDTRSPTAWTQSAVHPASPMRASTKIQPQTTCALTSGTGVPTAPKRSRVRLSLSECLSWAFVDMTV